MEDFDLNEKTIGKIIECFTTTCRKPQSFSFNSKYLILYDANTIKCLDLKKPFHKDNFILIDFEVHDHDFLFQMQYVIKDVQTSSNPNILVIIIC